MQLDDICKQINNQLSMINCKPVVLKTTAKTTIHLLSLALKIITSKQNPEMTHGANMAVVRVA